KASNQEQILSAGQTTITGDRGRGPDRTQQCPGYRRGSGGAGDGEFARPPSFGGRERVPGSRPANIRARDYRKEGADGFPGGLTFRQPGDPRGTHGFASHPCRWFTLSRNPLADLTLSLLPRPVANRPRSVNRPDGSD